MSAAISSRQRYSRTRRCPICGGCEQDPRGQEKRCTGYDGSDGKYAHCSREEHAGSLEQEASGTYAHKLAGKCKCGETHGEDNSVRPQIVATYDYVDEARALLFQVVRYDPKNFRQRSPNGAGGWIWSTKDVRKVLYRLPELLAADPQSPVYFCEGEKDVGALESRGLLATTSPGGAEDYGLNLWRNGLADHARKVLAGRAVHIIADKDRVGRDFARMVAGQLHDAARSLDVWECTLGKDAAAHLDAGGAMEDLEPLGDADDERAAIQNEPASDWPTPEPFDVVTLPAFPVEALSPWMRDWATAESTFTQTPVDLSACLALAAVSLAAARSFHVHVRGDYKEPCNLWIVVALEPGEKKSSVFADATAPIYAYAKHVAEKLAPTIHERAQARRILEAQVKDAEAHAVKGKNIGGVDARQVARERQAELEKLPEIHAPVLLTADCTPEALAVLLSHHGERMGIFSAEGGPFEMMAGRYADAGKTNLEIYLMGHPGDAHVVHRISREPINLSHPLLTMGLTVQPHVIAGLASKDGFRGRGLLGRFFYSLPRTALGHRVAEPPTVDGAVTLAYQTALASILMLRVEPRTLHLSPEAARARAALHDELEPRLDPNDGDLYPVADWANKLVGGVCRLAGVLHVADHATSLATIPAIPAATFDRAATIGRYFLVHSLHAFDAMGADDDLELARRVWAWVQRKGLASFTEYEAKRATHATPETIKLALAKLLDRNLVRERPPEGPTGGRPSSPGYDLNPRARR